jgi:hypothetical protein
MTGHVTIEQSQLGEERWAVIITRPEALLPRTLWGRFPTQAQAVSAAEAARAYLANPKIQNECAEQPLPDQEA